MHGFIASTYIRINILIHVVHFNNNNIIEPDIFHYSGFFNNYPGLFNFSLLTLLHILLYYFSFQMKNMSIINQNLIDMIGIIV